ncbi:hypothetical protein C8R44DRAFT_933939 [Mycena epipterygia]|nr:hypothetical protein C8R44DRAFT_933939 [Mycena epipterygia]
MELKTEAKGNGWMRGMFTGYGRTDGTGENITAQSNVRCRVSGSASRGNLDSGKKKAQRHDTGTMQRDEERTLSRRGWPSTASTHDEEAIQPENHLDSSNFAPLALELLRSKSLLEISPSALDDSGLDADSKLCESDVVEQRAGKKRNVRAATPWTKPELNGRELQAKCITDIVHNCEPVRVRSFLNSFSGWFADNGQSGYNGYHEFRTTLASFSGPKIDPVGILFPATPASRKNEIRVPAWSYAPPRQSEVPPRARRSSHAARLLRTPILLDTVASRRPALDATRLFAVVYQRFPPGSIPAGCAPLHQKSSPLPIPIAHPCRIHSPIPSHHANLPGLFILAPSSNQIQNSRHASHSTSVFCRLASLRQLRPPPPSSSLPSVPFASYGLQIFLPNAFIARPLTISPPASPRIRSALTRPRTPSPRSSSSHFFSSRPNPVKIRRPRHAHSDVKGRYAVFRSCSHPPVTRCTSSHSVPYHTISFTATWTSDSVLHCARGPTPPTWQFLCYVPVLPMAHLCLPPSDDGRRTPAEPLYW